MKTRRLALLAGAALIAATLTGCTRSIDDTSLAGTGATPQSKVTNRGDSNGTARMTTFASNRRRSGDDRRRGNRRQGEDFATGVKRRGDGSIDDSSGRRGRGSDDFVNGVKRRGDGSIDDNGGRRGGRDDRGRRRRGRD